MGCETWRFNTANTRVLQETYALPPPLLSVRICRSLEIRNKGHAILRNIMEQDNQINTLKGEVP